MKAHKSKMEFDSKRDFEWIDHFPRIVLNLAFSTGISPSKISYSPNTGKYFVQSTKFTKVSYSQPQLLQKLYYNSK